MAMEALTSFYGDLTLGLYHEHQGSFLLLEAEQYQRAVYLTGYKSDIMYAAEKMLEFVCDYGKILHVSDDERAVMTKSGSFLVFPSEGLVPYLKVSDGLMRTQVVYTVDEWIAHPTAVFGEIMRCLST